MPKKRTIQIGLLAPQIEPIVLLWGVVSGFFAEDTFNVTWCKNPNEVDDRFDYVIVNTEHFVLAAISIIKNLTEGATNARKIIVMGPSNHEAAAKKNDYLFIEIGTTDQKTAESLSELLEDFNGL